MKHLGSGVWLNLSSLSSREQGFSARNLISGGKRRLSESLDGEGLWSAGIDFAGCSCSTSMLLGGVSYSDTTAYGQNTFTRSIAKFVYANVLLIAILIRLGFKEKRDLQMLAEW